MSDELLNAGQENTATGEQDVATLLYGGDKPQGDADGKAVDDISKPKEPAADGEGEQPKAEGEGEKGDEQEGDYTFTVPEGYELNAEVTDEFKAFAKDLGLPPEKAQAAVDMGVKLIESHTKAITAAFEAQKEAWRNDVVNDKEIGGNNLTANLAVANKAIEAFFPPEFRSLLESTGLGNHPVLVKGLVAIGKGISEDRLVTGARGMGPRDPAEVLYGKK